MTNQMLDGICNINPSFCVEALRADYGFRLMSVNVPLHLELAMDIFQQTDHPTILIADDDPLILRLIAAALVPEGYYMITVSNGEQALAASRAHPGPIHMLLSDVQMPGMNGPELCEHIQSERPEIICGLMSGAVAASSMSKEMPFIEKIVHTG